MQELPEFTQPFWSWLTAKPLKQELEKTQTRTPGYHIATTSLTLLCGIACAAAGFSSGSFLLWLLGFVLTTSGIKKMQVMICHNCAHNMVFDSREANMRGGHLISGLMMLKPFDIYKKEHLLHHDHKTLLTENDDTLSFLQGVVGLTPSDSVAMMWFKLTARALSPAVILRSSIERIYATAAGPNRRVAVLTIGFWTVLTAAAIALNLWQYLLVAWVVPVFAGYHISTTFRLAAEHTWPSVDILERRGIDFISESTTGVFIGEELKIPHGTGRFGRMIRIAVWAGKMLTFHLFIRIFVMVGDTPCHDFHHRRPKSKDWPNYITARERDLEAGSKPYPSNYQDYWGYLTAVTVNFKNFRAARAYYETQPAT
ncbi:fatty acid desaturase [Leisingera sp. ANG59]|uniref:fatty acid desaturase family protein n=1 Tax=Leisingera sp. ANG59 TaxID=2675221 RepID=UPI001571E3C6|nr:fatty acid desaturase [Leisingera sp. ANG59]